MKHPPPIPLDAGLTTPRHKATAIAASMASPPLPSISDPMFEHIGLSDTTLFV